MTIFQRLFATRQTGADAFVQAVLAELPRLRRYAMALTHDVSLADDLVQDCVERALRRRDALDDQTRIAPWLRSILHNHYIDGVREQKRRGLHMDVQEIANLVSDGLAPDARLRTWDFLQAMNGLSVEHRQILLLVGLEGLSYREIADELEIPIGTVMSRLARARAQLRQRLEPAEDAPARSPRPVRPESA